MTLKLVMSDYQECGKKLLYPSRFAVHLLPITDNLT